MSMPGIRRSITDLQDDYEQGNKAPLEKLMRAWKGIKELDPSNLRSFFTLGGFHGEPFRGPGETDPAWWGGYCQHGTVLFPAWHRVYLYQLEKALQSIEGCGDVMLPFWDECSEESRIKGVPWALTEEFFELDGKRIANPLRSFVLPVGIVDQVQGDNALYSKHKGYETVRYPLSGLVGTPEDRVATAAHNAKYPDYGVNVGILNKNIIEWLNTSFMIDGKQRGEIYAKFVACLDAPTYTLFSNTTSAAAWNNANPHQLVMPLETPHNYMHLAVGGFDVPGQGSASLIPGANGDMGENDTAGLDPIFYFHHCFIDYAFWTWQKRNGATDSFTIDASDPGAHYVLGAGSNNQPPADSDPNQTITMQTGLDPFTKADGSSFTAADAINIETQLGYAYGPGSLDQFAERTAFFGDAAAQPAENARTVHVSGLDRSKIPGSFIISAYAEIDGERRSLGHEPVLSRWHVAGCANCQTHLRVSANFVLPVAGPGSEPPVHIEIKTRDAVLRHRLVAAGEERALTEAEAEAAPQPAFNVEIR
ncbi:tyrosinase family protein [Sphingomonas sp. PR090111-T3T-6A]|uniref:tyrosinase family protein n=1 Tax=Sphingomonas sp. PR090111-T3T-6A TaxID=685778 RepID=UPI00047597EA|nr:tyrosinase family protein [Sphingomonas sp. PR090111-T3T-6A]